MEILMKLLALAGENLYVMAFLLLPIYGIFWLLRKPFPKFPDPIGVVGFLTILGIFTLPFFARYSFEQETLSQLEEAKHLKLIDFRRYSAFIQPLTLFYSPIEIFYIAGPSDIKLSSYKKDSPTNSFKTVVLEYNRSPEIRFVDAECDDKTLSISGPDETGTLKYLAWNEKMNDGEIKVFCEEDYTEEMKILREKFINSPQYQEFKDKYPIPKDLED